MSQMRAPWLLALLVLVVVGLGAAYALTRKDDEQVGVPAVRGLTLTAARAKISAAGLVAEIKHVPGRGPAGTVVSQFPKAGKTLKRGGDVLVNASDGSLASQASTPPAPPASPRQTTAEQASVPNVLGEDEGTAFNTLQEAGFAPDAVEAPVSSADQDGLVQKQQPAGGTSAPPGSTVTIYIGRFSQTG